MVLIIEMIAFCFVFTLAVLFGTKKNPLNGLHNMPVALQERVTSLTQYKDVKVVHTKERGGILELVVKLSYCRY